MPKMLMIVTTPAAVALKMASESIARPWRRRAGDSMTSTLVRSRSRFRAGAVVGAASTPSPSEPPQPARRRRERQQDR
jgi:hypothetical protein